MSNESTIYLKVPMTQIYKFLNDPLPLIMDNIFQKQEKYYSLKKTRSLGRKYTTTYGIDTIFIRRPQIWQDLSLGIKNADSNVNLFKSNIKRC